MSEKDLHDDPQAVDEAAEADADVTEADAGPVDADAMDAAEGLTATTRNAAHYTDMVERGAHAKGEGQLP